MNIYVQTDPQSLSSKKSNVTPSAFSLDHSQFLGIGGLYSEEWFGTEFPLTPGLYVLFATMHYGEVAMGGVTFASHSDLPTLPLILSASKYFRLIFQLSLSFYPCPNIPDTFVGDEMNSCQSCSALFHKRGTHFILKTNTTHRK